MPAKILFSETQRFRQWWLWAILIGVTAVPVYLFCRELLAPQPFSNAENNTGILISLIGTLPISALFILMQLKTQITDRGIAVKFFPFHFSFREFTWSDLQEAYLKEYSPIADFGGWGLRYSLSGAGKAYNVAGSQGIQLVFKSGKKLLIGTQKPAAAAAALEQTQTLSR